jgi:ribosomal protein S18 acetylase RimI-like enzyme
MKSSPSTVIRKMRRADTPAMARMMNDLMIFHGDQPQAKPAHFAQQCLGKHRLVDSWVAVVARQPIGFVVTYDWFNFVRGTAARTIDLLYIDPDHRRSGIGKLLLVAVAKDAQAKGCTRLRVGARKTNKAANRFYHGLGFERRPENSATYAADEWVMKGLTKS